MEKKTEGINTDAGGQLCHAWSIDSARPEYDIGYVMLFRVLYDNIILLSFSEHISLISCREIILQGTGFIEKAIAFCVYV